MNCYLRGRQARVMFRNKLSKSRNIHVGVPQGAVTSPLLFSFYLFKLPQPTNAKIHLIQYADDISIFMSGWHIPSLTRAINKYLPELVTFLDERELLLSAEKSMVTLFTQDTGEFVIHPGVKISGVQMPLDQTPKLLGVVFDTMRTPLLTISIDSVLVPE